MSRTLLLLRHAKSSWDNSQLDDHDRPLNGRGREAASRIGRLLKHELLPVDRVLCSTAARTRETAKRVFAELSTAPMVCYRDDLYHASADQLVQVFCQLDESIQCPMLIGHNPGLEEFSTQVTGQSMQFPTAGLALIELSIGRWSSFANATRGQLKQMWRPRELKSE